MLGHAPGGAADSITHLGFDERALTVDAASRAESFHAPPRTFRLAEASLLVQYLHVTNTLDIAFDRTSRRTLSDRDWQSFLRDWHDFLRLVTPVAATHRAFAVSDAAGMPSARSEEIEDELAKSEAGMLMLEILGRHQGRTREWWRTVVEEIAAEDAMRDPSSGSCVVSGQAVAFRRSRVQRARIDETADRDCAPRAIAWETSATRPTLQRVARARIRTSAASGSRQASQERYASAEAGSTVGRSSTLVAVPEPGSGLLLASGLFALARYRARLRPRRPGSRGERRQEP
ncbi:MAG: hypothetical protein ACQGVC_23930 [Myxococcota bacterium]